jgi:hypothetical protein
MDERRLIHGGLLLQCSFQVGERFSAVTLVERDPALADLADRGCVQVVVLLPAAAEGGHEVRRLENGQVLAHRLSGHVES